MCSLSQFSFTVGNEAQDQANKYAFQQWEAQNGNGD